MVDYVVYVYLILSQGMENVNSNVILNVDGDNVIIYNADCNYYIDIVIVYDNILVDIQGTDYD